MLEIWGAEYQENDCLLIRPDKRDLMQSICDRERCFMQASPRSPAAACATHTACQRDAVSPPKRRSDGVRVARRRLSR